MKTVIMAFLGGLRICNQTGLRGRVGGGSHSHPDHSMRRRKRLLVVEDNPIEQSAIHELLWHDDIDVKLVGSGGEALLSLEDEAFDCIVLDLRLPDMSGFQVLEELSRKTDLRDVPVIVFTGRDLTNEEDAQLHTLARSVVVKDVESPERLLDETALFLHRVVADLPIEEATGAHPEAARLG